MNPGEEDEIPSYELPGTLFNHIHILKLIKLKGMTFDHDFSYFLLYSLPPCKKKEVEKQNVLAKIVIKVMPVSPILKIPIQHL